MNLLDYLIYGMHSLRYTKNWTSGFEIKLQAVRIRKTGKMKGEIAAGLGNVDIDQMKVCTFSITMTANCF